MKKRLIAFLTTFLLVATLAEGALAREFPEPQGFVNDYAGLYSSEFRSELETKLSDFEKESTAEIAVVTIDSLEGDVIENVAVDLFEQWGIGKKGEDNGLLILIAEEDREIKIEVGYGLEPKINDAAAGRIIRNKMSPEFKKEDYEKGTSLAVEELMGLIRGEVSDSDSAASDGSSDDGSRIFWSGFALFWILFIYVSAFLSRSKSFHAGGIVGAILGTIFGLLVGSLLVLLFGALLFGLIGLFLDWIFSKNYKIRKKTGKSTSWWGSKGGFSSGGFGGGGGGGFGGFGGGSSGGGGASGGW